MVYGGGVYMVPTEILLLHHLFIDLLIHSFDLFIIDSFIPQQCMLNDNE